MSLMKLFNKIVMPKPDEYMDVYKKYKLEFAENIGSEDFQSIKLFLIPNCRNVLQLCSAYAVVEVTGYNLAILLNNEQVNKVVVNYVQVPNEIVEPSVRKLQVKLIFDLAFSSYKVSDVIGYFTKSSIPCQYEYIEGNRYIFFVVLSREELLDIWLQFKRVVRLDSAVTLK